MKRIKIFFTAALLVAASARVTTVSADGKLDQILNEMQKSAATITTIYANMEQLKRDPNIGGTAEKYRGQVFFKHFGKGNDKVKIVYSSPKGQTVWIVGDEVTLYQASIGQAIITSRKAAASRGAEFSAVATPYASVPELKRQYNIVYVGEESGMAKLELTPKGKSSLKSMTLWVDQSSWLPAKSHIVETSGNASTFIFSGMKKNSVISNGTFEVKLPKDAKIIRK
ncbi:MAG TPA: outer-membrane lipoprotein carrier protein LolA [Blastocatellia bacterium]|jgi:outer membrane lipoprotein-sorting protein